MTFNSSKLTNGLNIVSFNMPFLNSIAINLIVKVGSRFENISEAGISHFLEHMAFKGTLNRTSKMIAEEFDAIGGHFNAYTSREQTVYYAKVIEDKFETALEILADIIQNSLFSEEEIEKEFKVIVQEIAGVQDNPDELVYEKFYNVAYANQPLGRSILGIEEVLSKFNKKSFLDYLDKHYNAENIYLAVAGKIEHERVVNLAANLFSKLKSSKNQTFEPASYTGGYNYINKDLEQISLVLGFESVPYINLEEFYHSQILSIILGGGISSRLFQQIRENLGLVYSIGSYNNCYYDSGLFSIYTSSAPDKIELILENLINEIKKISEHISETELTRAKQQIKTSIYMAEEKSAYKADEIGKNFSIFGRYYSPEEILTDIIKTSPADITNIAKKIFTTNPTLSIVGINKFDEERYLKLCQNLK